MDRLLFKPDPDDDIAALYQRLVGDEMAAAEREARDASWRALAAALLRVLQLAEAGGLGPAALDALDAELIAAAQVAARGQRVAFEAGLRAGAALAGLQGPSAN